MQSHKESAKIGVVRERALCFEIDRRADMQEPKKSLGRRTVLAGAGTASALAAAAVVLPMAQKAETLQPATVPAQPDTAAGYRLTEHVKRYYASARI
jgi:hypothetical protein